MKTLVTIAIIILVSINIQKINAQEVKLNTNLVVEADGTLRMDGDAIVWDDLRVPLTFGTSSLLATNWEVFLGTTYLDCFKASGTDALYFVVQLPHSWKEGTTIYPHIHWIPQANGATNANDVVWELEYTWANNGETFPGTTKITGSTITPALSGNLVAKTHYITPLGSGITADGKKISSMLVCRIARLGDNGSDTFTGTAGVLEIDFHHQVDTFGSREEYNK